MTNTGLLTLSLKPVLQKLLNQCFEDFVLGTLKVALWFCTDVKDNQ